MKVIVCISFTLNLHNLNFGITIESGYACYFFISIVSNDKLSPD